MIHAIIFDCDGVIADTEPLHYQAFERVLAEPAVPISRADYFSRYVGLNDPTFLRRIFTDAHRPLDEAAMQRLLDAKNDTYLSMIVDGIELLPGVADFVARWSKRRPLAVCSGARRVEIETILRHTGLAKYFPIIVSSDDVAISKPDPAGFLRTVELLRPAVPRLSAAHCLVIEDSPHGITAARAAGMRVLAVLSQCRPEQLAQADVIVPDLSTVTDAMIAAL